MRAREDDDSGCDSQGEIIMAHHPGARRAVDEQRRDEVREDGAELVREHADAGCEAPLALGEPAAIGRRGAS